MPESTNQMKKVFYYICLLLICTSTVAMAQDKEERREEQAERRAANKEKVDYNVFRRQILTLPEYSALRRKLPEYRQQGKPMPRIMAVVDSNAESDEKTLTGYIQLVTPDESMNMYEVTYDRVAKKIVQVKETGEKPEKDEDEAKSTTHKKKKADEDDEDDEDEKPAKGNRTDDE